MKRTSEERPPLDPVLAQLDALINGAPPRPTKAVRTEEPPLVARDPVLAHLDALINPGQSAALPIHFATPVALVLPLPPPPLLALEHAPEPRGPPGLLRELGGVKGYMAMLRADAEDAATSAGR